VEDGTICRQRKFDPFLPNPGATTGSTKMKKTFLLLPAFFGIAACGNLSGGGDSNVCYRYANSLDFGKNNALDAVTVTGRDDQGVKEATRLDVKIGEATITLRDMYEGKPGAMYNPRVDLSADGALVVGWSQMGESDCTVEITSDAGGKLYERKRTLGAP